MYIYTHTQTHFIQTFFIHSLPSSALAVDHIKVPCSI